jgi:hypothetical protein
LTIKIKSKGFFQKSGGSTKVAVIFKSGRLIDRSLFLPVFEFAREFLFWFFYFFVAKYVEVDYRIFLGRL